MGGFEKIVGISFGLVLVYLLVTNANGANTVLTGAGNSYSGVLRTLQGR